MRPRQRSGLRSSASEAGVDHKICVATAGTGRPPIRASTCLHPLPASHGCPETLLSSCHLPSGDGLLFNGHHSQASLK